jgi:chromate transport protein ChrA
MLTVLLDMPFPLIVLQALPGLDWCRDTLLSLLLHQLYAALKLTVPLFSLAVQALPGFNAAGVGLIVASVFDLTFGALSVSDFEMTSLCIGILAFTAVDQLKWFEPAVVVAGGVMGIIAWAGKMM